MAISKWKRIPFQDTSFLSNRRASPPWAVTSTDVFEPCDATVDSGGILALEDALQSLAKEDPRSAHVAELRIFGGLEPEHIARLLDLSSATVTRDWRFAKAWLQTDYDVRVRTGAIRPSAANNVIDSMDDSSDERSK
jgi:DNA-directed RNA polymerase specialized sigma24 family protein